MRRAAWALALCLAASPARAWRLWGEPSDKKIRPVQALSDQGKAAEVIAALTPDFMQSLRGTDLRQAYVLRGENLHRLGRTDEALGVYQLGVKLFPKNVDLLTRQGDLLHRTGLDEQAQPLYLKALEYEPRHFGAHLGLAEIFRRLGFLDRSASHYEAALESLDKNAVVWRDYAETLLAQRDWTTAELALQRALALEPGNPENRVLFGFARRAQGDSTGAVAALDEALARGAGIGAKRAKALWLVEAGRHAEALAAADEVLRDSPGDAAALWARARVQLARGQPAKAVAELSSLTAAPRQDFSARAARALRDKLSSEAIQ
ncbi:MAG: tetratricopeptide repeat protein [Elusimicrobia bacterium]|nr:tetratricopeptide repeat protein [Elusimicrobiota bacterium]